MPPRGLAVVVPTSNVAVDKLQSVRDQLRSEAFWSRRKRSRNPNVEVEEKSSFSVGGGTEFGEEEHETGPSPSAPSQHTESRTPKTPSHSEDRRENGELKETQEIVDAEKETPQTPANRKAEALGGSQGSGEAHSKLGPPDFLADSVRFDVDDAKPEDDQVNVLREIDRIISRSPAVTSGQSARLLSAQTRSYLNMDKDGTQLPSEQDGRKFFNATWKERRHTIHKVLMDPTHSAAARGISVVILLAILVSSTTFCLETLPRFQGDPRMATIEDACIMLFTCEYVAKLLTAPRVLEFIRGPLNLIDLVAIIPWYLQFATGRQGLAASVLRIIRLARILKLGGRWGKVQVVTRALLHSLDVLAVLLFLMLATVVIFSALIYYTEEERAEEADVEGFGSIPESFWWTVVTINTVGYGDVVPITDWGKAVASLLMVVGLLVMALPVSVIGTNFTQEWMEYKDNLAHEEATKNLPPNVRFFDELMSEHVDNLDEILSRYQATEETLDYLRIKLQDKMNRAKSDLDQRQRADGMRTDSGGAPDVESDDSDDSIIQGRHIGIARLFGRDKSGKLADHSKKQLEEIKELEQHIVAHRLYLKDLLSATEVLRSNQFEELLKSIRMKYKQLGFVREESLTLQSTLDEIENKVQKLDVNLGYCPSSKRSSQLDPMSSFTPAKAWQKIRKYSMIRVSKTARRVHASSVSDGYRTSITDSDGRRRTNSDTVASAAVRRGSPNTLKSSDPKFLGGSSLGGNDISC